MFKKKFSKIWLLLLVIVGGSFMYFSNASIQYAEEANEPMKELSNNELLNLINKYDPLIVNMSNKLRDEKYGFLLDYGILPSGEIEIIVNLPYKVNKETKKKIENIIKNVVKENNLKSDFFCNKCKESL